MVLTSFIKKAILTLTLITCTGVSVLAYEQNKQEPEPTSFLQIADNFYRQFQYDSAVTYYNYALEISNANRNEPLSSRILSLRGKALRIKGWNNLAYDSYILARKKAQKLRNDTLCALADIGLGHVYEEQGRLDSAEFFYNHALKDYKKVNDSLGIGLALHHLSMFYQTKVDYEKSLLYALESYRIFNQLSKDSDHYIRSLMNLGNIYEALKEYDTAFSCYEQCYQLSLQINNIKLAAQAATNKAVIYYHEKEYEKAKDEFLNAIRFNEKINDTKELSLLYRNASVMLKYLGKYDEALKLSEKSLLFARKIQNKELETKALLNLGGIHKMKKDYAESEKYYLEGIAIAEETGLLYDLRIGYANISLLYKALDNYKDAYTYIIKYTEIKDSINNKEKIRAREKYKAEYELLHYKDQNRINKLEKKKMRFERNLAYTIAFSIVLLLVILLFLFRMRARKNRIIAEQRIQKLEDEKKLMAAQSVLVGQEKERERIARELHDGIGVLLSTASIHFSSVESKADKETGEMLKKANKLLKDASKEVRQISHNMMPGVLAKFGLKEAIEDLFEEVEDAGEIEIDLQVVCKKERLAENTEIMIYRIIQEMLNNTIKHANASKISLHIIRQDDKIDIEYMDNGIGFEEVKLSRDKNLGLSGIRTRVEFLGGTVDLISTPKEGTRYKIWIPL